MGKPVMFAELKINTIVTTGVVTLAALAAAVAASGSMGISHVRTSLDHIESKSVPSVATLGNISTETTRADVVLSQEVLAQSTDMKRKDETRLETLNSQIEKDLADYQRLEVDVKEHDALETVRRDWAAWKEQMERTLTASLNHEDDQAEQLLRGQVSGAADQLRRDERAATNYNLHLVEQKGSEAREHADEAFTRNLVLCGVSLLVAGGIFLLFRSRVTRPLVRLNNAMITMATGKLDVEVPGQDKRDELGEIARSLGGIKTSIEEKSRRDAEAQIATQRQVVGALGEGLSALKAGNLTHAIDQVFPADYESLRADFNNAVSALNEMMQEIAQAAQSVRSGSGEISSAASDLARRTESQAASLEETAASVRELTTAVTSSEGTAATASRSAQEANVEASNSGEVMRDAVAAMDAISVSSEKMKSIVEIIDGLSFQTNLLALNAGVEAARAGQVGNGFAVVAGEVRALAQRSAEAAKDIGDLIKNSSNDVTQGVRMIHETRASLDQIATKTAEVSNLISGIAEGTQRQSASIQQVNSVVGEMDKITQQNAALVEESNAASISLATQADRLNDIVARFKTGAPIVRRPPARPPVTRSAAPSVPTVAGNTALAVDEDDWTDF